MDRGAGRNVLQRQRIANQDVRIGSRSHRRAHLEPHGLQDITLLAVRVMHQRDPRRTVGIVFDGRHAPRNPVLIAFEVDQPQHLLVAAALVADGQVAHVTASPGALLDRQERLVRLIRRQVVVHQRGLEPQRRGYRSVCLDWHRLYPGKLAPKIKRPFPVSPEPIPCFGCR